MVMEHKLDPMIGRDPEVMRVIQILSRRTKKQSNSYWRSWSWKDCYC